MDQMHQRLGREMNRAVDALQALGVIAMLGVAGAIGACDSDSAESTTMHQIANLCSAPGWPADAKIAYERACRGELRRKST